jgi:hypothetical protein
MAQADSLDDKHFASMPNRNRGSYLMCGRVDVGSEDLAAGRCTLRAKASGKNCSSDNAPAGIRPMKKKRGELPKNLKTRR